MNEKLWHIVDAAQLEGSDYYSAYASLAENLGNSLDRFESSLHQRFLRKQVEKMRLWLEVVDRTVL